MLAPRESILKAVRLRRSITTFVAVFHPAKKLRMRDLGRESVNREHFRSQAFSRRAPETREKTVNEYRFGNGTCKRCADRKRRRRSLERLDEIPSHPLREAFTTSSPAAAPEPVREWLLTKEEEDWSASRSGLADQAVREKPFGISVRGHKLLPAGPRARRLGATRIMMKRLAPEPSLLSEWQFAFQRLPGHSDATLQD